MSEHPMSVLQRARAAKGVGLRAFAEALGVPVTTVSGWDAGYEAIPSELRQRVRDVLRLTPIEDYVIEMAEDAPLRDRELERLEVEKAIAEGRAFASYAHQEGDPKCPCNSCRFERDDYGPAKAPSQEEPTR